MAGFCSYPILYFFAAFWVCLDALFCVAISLGFCWLCLILWLLGRLGFSGRVLAWKLEFGHCGGLGQIFRVAGLDCFGLARVVAVWDWAIFVSPFPKTFASVFRYRFVLVRYVFSIQSLFICCAHSHSFPFWFAFLYNLCTPTSLILHSYTLFLFGTSIQSSPLCLDMICLYQNRFTYFWLVLGSSYLGWFEIVQFGCLECLVQAVAVFGFNFLGQITQKQGDLKD